MSTQNPWPPEDTESRRVADLREFFRKDPEAYDRLCKEDQEECWQYLPPEFQAGEKAFKRPAPASKAPAIKPGCKRSNSNENKWDLETSLALIREMKKCVVDNKVSSVGVSMERWVTISTALSNPRGIEQRKYARSCQVRYDNMRRYIKAGKLDLVQEEIRVALDDFWETCQHYARPTSRTPPSNKKAGAR